MQQQIMNKETISIKVEGRGEAVTFHLGMISVDHHFEDPFRRDLKEAIGSLKPNQREAVTNYYIRDMSFPETGRAMGVGTSTAEYWVKAGVSKIRRSGTVANEGRAL